MMQLTRAGEYGVRAVIYLAAQPEGKIIFVGEISESQDIPKSFASKILQILVKSSLVRSQRGVKGGFMLAKPASQITLRDVIEVVEGPIFLNQCLIKKGECPRDDFCPVHPVWREAQDKLMEILGGATIAGLVENGKALEKRMGKQALRKKKP
ncbi:MAG: Rrf2 family transcriptional regulator [Nitrospirota bacterium]